MDVDGEILSRLQVCLDSLAVGKKAIDAMLKCDVDQTRMSYCFNEYKDVSPRGGLMG